MEVSGQLHPGDRRLGEPQDQRRRRGVDKNPLPTKPTVQPVAIPTEP
jgi:hypothetical protein